MGSAIFYAFFPSLPISARMYCSNLFFLFAVADVRAVRGVCVCVFVCVLGLPLTQSKTHEHTWWVRDAFVRAYKSHLNQLLLKPIVPIRIVVRVCLPLYINCMTIA